MSISYSALTTHNKIRLPSVESWSSNMSIIKDPPRSIHTTRIDKVGQTSDITASIDEATDRACESILQYARGVNPMVSVSYNNSQNQSGQVTNGQQAFLPYRVARDGAFRPPVNTEYNLAPLSRLPRVWTSAFSKSSFPNFSQKMMFNNNMEKSREIKEEVLKLSVRPTAVYNIETPHEKPYETKYAVQNALQKAAFSNIKSNIQLGGANDYIDNNLINVKNAMNIDCSTVPTSNNNKVTYIHDDLNLKRTMPEHNAYTSKTNSSFQKLINHEHMKQLERTMPEHNAYSAKTNSSFQKLINHEHMKQLEQNMPTAKDVFVNKRTYGEENNSARNYNLLEKISPGGFHIPGQVPQQDRNTIINENLNNEKALMNKKYIEQHMGRFGSAPPFLQVN